MRLHLPACPRNTLVPRTKSDAQLHQKKEGKEKPKKNESKKGEGRGRIKDIIHFLYVTENNF